MKRKRDRQEKAQTLLEMLESRELLSGTHLFHAPGGAGHVPGIGVHQARLFSGATALTFVGFANDAPGFFIVSGPLQQLATFHSTARLADMTVTIDWGDGSAVTNGTVTGVPAHGRGGSAFAISGEHVYSARGTYQVVIHLMIRAGGGMVTEVLHTSSNILERQTDTQAQTPVLPTLTLAQEGYAVTASANVAASLLPEVSILAGGSEVVLSPADARIRYEVVINWGDGTTSDAAIEPPHWVVSANNTTLSPLQLSGAHTYSTSGNYAVTATVFAAYTGSEAATAGAPETLLGPTLPAVNGTVRGRTSDNVADVSVSLNSLNVPELFRQVSSQVREFIWMSDPNVQYVAAIDWGDGLSSSAQVIPPSGPSMVTIEPGDGVHTGPILPIDPTTLSPVMSVNGSHAYLTWGRFDVTIILTAIYQVPGESPIVSTVTVAVTVDIPGGVAAART